MKTLKKIKYSFKVHLAISLLTYVLISLIKHINNLEEAHVIGITGEADGPLVIYGADNISYLLMKCIIAINNLSFIPIVIILTLVYKPIKYIIEKIKVV